jgi:cytochrome c oxidase subunit 2
MPRPHLTAIAFVVAVAPVAGIATPLSYLRTYGPAADPITTLGWGLGLIASFVCAIVGVLLLAAIFRRRVEPLDAEGRPVLQRDAGGMRFVYVGVGLSTIVLFAATVWTLTTLSAVAAVPNTVAAGIHVVGHQWWWEVRYDGTPRTSGFTTANEIHVPVGAPVRVELTSPDVIHSFWVPQLGGKLDVVPGQRNVTWLEAAQAGVYQGRCAEYCGLQHAHMALTVVAVPVEQFDAWLAREAADADAQALGALPGAANFEARCAACHTVRGTPAHGIVGPDLTHVATRRTLAAGTLPNDRVNLVRWIAAPQDLKPGCRMPRLGLPADELDRVAAYVERLH